MIIFEKNIEKILPYNREQYLNFLYDASTSSVKWYGLSFQINGNDEPVSLMEYIDNYESFLKELILNLKNNSYWIVNHEGSKDFDWFPNKVKNLPSLRSLFRERNILGTYRGALLFTEEDLLKYTKDLILYPYVVLNKKGLLFRNINISHDKLPLVIKTTGHYDIDVLSTDEMLLKEIFDQYSQYPFIIKKYRGTIL
jgi:hypothetical protein